MEIILYIKKKIYYSSKILRPFVSNGKHTPRDSVFCQVETIIWDWNSHGLGECAKK